MRNAVKRLVTGKLTIVGDAGIQHAVLESDIDTLLDRFSSTLDERTRAQAILEEWLKEAIDVDLRYEAEEAQRRRAGIGQH